MGPEAKLDGGQREKKKAKKITFNPSFVSSTTNQQTQKQKQKKQNKYGKCTS